MYFHKVEREALFSYMWQTKLQFMPETFFKKSNGVNLRVFCLLTVDKLPVYTFILNAVEVHA